MRGDRKGKRPRLNKQRGLRGHGPVLRAPCQQGRTLEEMQEVAEERTRRVRIMARVYEMRHTVDYQAPLLDQSDGLLTCSECKQVIDLATDDGKGAEWFGEPEGWACRACLGKPIMGP